jgi:hypothetical protein
VIVETASTRGERPKLRATLTTLKPGDTLVIYKPDRIARSMKELLVLLEDELHAREVNLHILTGICAGIHRRKPGTGTPGTGSWKNHCPSDSSSASVNPSLLAFTRTDICSGRTRSCQKY